MNGAVRELSVWWRIWSQMLGCLLLQPGSGESEFRKKNRYWELCHCTLEKLLYVESSFSVYSRCHAKTYPRHMQMVKAQISLCICTVWSGPLQSAYRITGYFTLLYCKEGSRHLIGFQAFDWQTRCSYTCIQCTQLLTKMWWQSFLFSLD